MLTSSHGGGVGCPSLPSSHRHTEGIPEKPSVRFLLSGRQSLHPRNWQVTAGEPNLACGFYFCMSYELLRMVFMLKKIVLDTVVHAYNSSSEETEDGVIEGKANLGSVVRPCLNNNCNKTSMPLLS